MKKRILFMAITLILLIPLAACGTDSAGGKQNSKNEVTIGYFPNLTHIATIVGLEKGYFKESFGDVEIKTKTFTQGGLFMEALATDAVDIGTTGPGPVLNFYAKDPKYHILSGSVNGGAVLVARKGTGIKSVKDLAGKKVIIPGIGNTQDIMMRKELDEADLKAKANGGNVDLHPTAPADAASLFKQSSVDAAAVPEPWGHILETGQGARIVLDWQDFAWGKETPVTVVASSDRFLKDKNNAIAYLQAQQKSIEFIHEHEEEAKELVIQHLKKLTGKALDKAEVDAAFSRMEVTSDLNEDVIQDMADLSKEANYIPNSKIDGMVDLQYLQTK